MNDEYFIKRVNEVSREIKELLIKKIEKQKIQGNNEKLQFAFNVLMNINCSFIVGSNSLNPYKFSDEFNESVKNAIKIALDEK